MKASEEAIKSRGRGTSFEVCVTAGNNRFASVGRANRIRAEFDLSGHL